MPSLEDTLEHQAVSPPGLLFIAVVLSLLALFSLNSLAVALVSVALLGTVALFWLLWRVHRDPGMFLCVLVLIESFVSTTLLPLSDDQRYLARYPLLLLFCLPSLFTALRDPISRRGGFGTYWLYLLWGVASVGYSLMPGYSFARVAAAILLFAALVRITNGVTDASDVGRLLRWFALACGLVWIATVISMFTLPHDQLWGIEGETGMDRFRGIFDAPNSIGELGVVTIGTAIVLWPAAQRWLKALLAAQIAVAAALSALADSRSSLVSIGLGVVAYAFWRYRSRALLIFAVAGALMLGALVWVPRAYFTRGEVGTLTGRTDVWRFALGKIEQRPWTGWGFEVEGQILQDPHFPVWWGPWDLGPRSSLHNGYLSRMIGVGVPATIIWLFVFARPWFSMFRSRQDPWRLKPLALLIVLPLLVVNMTESAVMDCRYCVGLLAILAWTLAERHRLALAADNGHRLVT